MKILNSNGISAFGGLNFVIAELDNKEIGKTLNETLPKLGAQSKYNWRDLLYSYWSVFFCGGDCAEDLSSNFKPNFSESPKIKIPSPDRVLNRLKELAEPTTEFATGRGEHLHQFAINEKLTQLNLEILKRITKFTDTMVDLDYDNTVCYTEKEDAQITYKKCYGYVPGVALVGSNVVYVENRNGRSNAGILQSETLERMFRHLENHNIKTDRFRADSASYEFRTIRTIEKHTNRFYVKARMSSTMDTVISSVKEWEVVGDKEDGIFRGEVYYTPFKRAAKDYKLQDDLHEYRFIVTKEKRKDGQINTFTKEACVYSIIITNDQQSKPDDIVFYYNQRGTIEKEFDVLKNDFGWQKLPFSTLEQNQVYLQIMAICRNIYHYIINLFSKKVKGLQPNYRIKKFIFRFIAIPAKWVYHSRQWHLKIYGTIHWYT